MATFACDREILGNNRPAFSLDRSILAESDRAIIGVFDHERTVCRLCNGQRGEPAFHRVKIRSLADADDPAGVLAVLTQFRIGRWACGYRLQIRAAKQDDGAAATAGQSHSAFHAAVIEFRDGEPGMGEVGLFFKSQKVEYGQPPVLVGAREGAAPAPEGRPAVPGTEWFRRDG